MVTDAELLGKVRNGQRELYGQIFTRYWKGAYDLAFHYTRNKEDAMDVVQDAFIKAYRNLSRFDPSCRFGPWLSAIVRNHCMDLLRKRKRVASEELSLNLRDDSSVGPENQVLQRELWKALDQLDREQREIIFLKDFQGHTYTEIAEILSIPLGTVMSRLHHARKKLQETLRGSCHAL